MDEKIEAFREMTEKALKAIRLDIGNVGCLTTEAQRSIIISDIKRLEHSLKGERNRHRIRANRNDDRASKRITQEGKEKFSDRSSFYNRLVKVIEVYLVKLKWLVISARNQFEKYEIEIESPVIKLTTIYVDDGKVFKNIDIPTAV